MAMPKKSVLMFCLVTSAVIGGLAYWEFSQDEPTGETLTAHDASTQNKNTDTIADKWQWNNFASTKPAEDSEGGKSSPASAVPSDVVGIYRILQSIKLDENGRVVPDQTLKEALELGFDELGPNLNAVALSELQNSIRKGLPGSAGEQAAHILRSYYQFRLSEEAFNRQLESETPNQSSAADRHKELVLLRRTALGEEIASKLFAVEDNQARHMFAAIAIQQNASLTAEEKQAQQERLQEQLNDRLLAQGQLEPAEAAAEKVRRLQAKGASSADIYSTREAILGAENARKLAAADREEAQWQSRFNGYWQARNYVMQAALDEAERERQIGQLLEQYFSVDERERARDTSADWQARDAK
jgi:lipase chaperone LimK